MTFLFAILGLILLLVAPWTSSLGVAECLAMNAITLLLAAMFAGMAEDF